MLIRLDFLKLETDRLVFFFFFLGGGGGGGGGGGQGLIFSNSLN